MDDQTLKAMVERLGLAPEQASAMSARLEAASARVAEAKGSPLAAALTAWSEQRAARSAHDRRLEEAEAAVARLRTDLAAADVMLRHVASVFGACAACWGRNAACPRCGGHGGPGSRPPDEAELLAWAQPALARVGCRVVRQDDGHGARRRSSDTRGEGA